MANNAKKTQKDIKENKTKVNNKKENVKKENNSSKEKNKINNKKETKNVEINNEEVIEKEIVKEEKKVKDKKIREKKERKNNFSNFMEKVDENRWIIIFFIVGFLLATLLFRCILWPERIAELKDGTEPIVKFDGNTLTADDLYVEMKNYYKVNTLLNTIDDKILTKKYPDSDEMEKEIKETAEYYYSSYESYYGYNKETFLSQYGFSSEKDFLDSLRLDYRRNKYYDEYVNSLVTEKEIEKYYNDEVFGDVDSKHILVSIKKDGEEDGLSDEEAKKLANEIINKLNGGTSWDDVIKEYEDKIIHEELGYNAYNASLESSYLKESKDLAVGTYSKSPVLTSYGYHIVYKIDQKDKPELKSIKDDIIEAIANKKKDADSNLYYKALVVMRDEAKIEFSDTKFASEYEKYKDNYK